MPSSVHEEAESVEMEGGAIISKTQMKKQARRKKWLETRDERRKIEKEKKKTRKRILAQEREKLDKTGQMQLVSRRPTLMKDSSNKFRIVIDMDFEEFMTDNEIMKAAKQVGRIYSINRHSEHPCQLYISSLKGKIRDRFNITNTGYQNWDINHSELDYVTLFGKGLEAEAKASDCQTTTDSDNTTTTKPENNFIYLTGDTEDDLPDVDDILKDESKIFVIGGLVDHNRHKSLCYKRALERNISTARLPIKQHVTLSQRHILSTVTVFEIMLKILGYHKSWSEALLDSIPKRKIASQSSGVEGNNI